jgi:hypothetical protein
VALALSMPFSIRSLRRRDRIAWFVARCPQAMARADVMVVLGGGGPPRAQHAAALFRVGFSQRVLGSVRRGLQ